MTTQRDFQNCRFIDRVQVIERVTYDGDINEIGSGGESLRIQKVKGCDYVIIHLKNTGVVAVQSEIKRKIVSISVDGLTLSLEFENLVQKQTRRRFNLTFFDQGAVCSFIECYNQSLVDFKYFSADELLDYAELLSKAEKDDEDDEDDIDGEDDAGDKLAELSLSAEGNDNHIFAADTDDEGSRKSSFEDSMLDDSIEPSQDPFHINGVLHPFGRN